MSNARKCNMCKRCFDPLDEKGRIARFSNPILQTSNDIKEMRRGDLLIPELGVDGIIDLCPECSEKLYEMFYPGHGSIRSHAKYEDLTIRNVGGDCDGDTNSGDGLFDILSKVIKKNSYGGDIRWPSSPPSWLQPDDTDD